MKYMGSKRSLLQNGLGELIEGEAAQHERVVDLFTGSAAVAWFVAERVDRPVVAVDLQHYATSLAQAVLGRTTKRSASRLEKVWLGPLRDSKKTKTTAEWRAKRTAHRVAASEVRMARRLSADAVEPLVRAYGGHYFSPEQAAQLQRAVDTLPDDKQDRAVCRAALIIAASRCAAAPGHTAQPFQPTPSALPYIESAWSRDLPGTTAQAVEVIASKHARVKGETAVADALDVARTLSPKDLVIIDPPYSAVQYSRFYHVLETIAREEVASVAGVGRYPERSARPRSTFSLKSEARTAFAQLLDSVAEAGSSALVTFPAGECSNGISGAWLARAAREHFDVEQTCVLGRFSTLGGNGSGRKARKPSAELILTLRPR